MSGTRGRSRTSSTFALLFAMVVGACGGTGAQATAAPSAPAASAAAAANPALDALIAAAKAEGKLVISGPPTPETRASLPKAFKDRFGIDIEYLSGSTGTLLVKVESERKAGLYTLDVILGGAQSLYQVAYAGKMLDPVKPALIDKEVLDGSKWISGSPWFMDPEGQYILRIANYVTNHVVVNTKNVKVADLKSWKDLQKPEYKGKLSFYDPTTAGTGWNTANFLLRNLGDAYIRSVYVDQQPGLSSDFAQLADWMARGQYPISMGLRESEIEKLRSEGFPVEVVPSMPEAPGLITAGFGLAVMMNKAPHPNAAKLFVNWIVTKEGQEVWSKGEKVASVRLDVDNAKIVPAYAIPKSGVKYFDSYDYDFTVNSRNPQELEKLKKLVSK